MALLSVPWVTKMPLCCPTAAAIGNLFTIRLLSIDCTRDSMDMPRAAFAAPPAYEKPSWIRSSAKIDAFPALPASWGARVVNEATDCLIDDQPSKALPGTLIEAAIRHERAQRRSGSPHDDHLDDVGKR